MLQSNIISKRLPQRNANILKQIWCFKTVLMLQSNFDESKQFWLQNIDASRFGVVFKENEEMSEC